MGIPTGVPQGRPVPTRKFRKFFTCRYCGMLWKLTCFKRRHERVCPENPDRIESDPQWGTRYLKPTRKNEMRRIEWEKQQ